VGVLDAVFAAAYDRVLGHVEHTVLGDVRERLIRPLAGHVVEIGAGTGANLAHVGAGVEQLTLLEPTPEMATKLRHKLAEWDPQAASGGRSRTRVQVEVIEAPAEAIPVADGGADAVVSTLVLCSVGDVERSLAEIRRVLRPGGDLVLLEHVRSGGRMVHVQQAIEPVWKVVARGCHLTRDTLAAVAAAGFDTADLARWELPGGGPAAPAIAGVARLR
jgi:ubiquinone/menaquinone biosynthesis C-methylase UbiE